ncbi:PSD1 and planctomycete cytochrome C domain-containing protein [Verrucomicrobiales bacterium]|nr:PSD1 and planctomycete cytochrome C domain-containing protein [Verrucomicrobiales bacterium]MDB4358798.1 PSD1 and planctomycete cytochrome C domain-containing protein [Verrucomicrobiales bacterium]
MTATKASILITFLVSLATSGAVFCADPPPTFEPAQIEFFEKEIRPILADNCLDCHSGTKAKVGLQLDHREGWISGSDYRKVIQLDKPAESILVKAIKHSGEKGILSMPEKGDKLADADIEKITQWITMGLPWPEYEDSENIDPSEHWSFQPVKKPPLPEDAGHPIDYFLKEAKKKVGVVSADKADRKTLYRRAHFDLLGLPPKFDEAEKFIADSRPDQEAWPALIDQLLTSPHYGERWARQWMDIARYSDTKGYEGAGRERRFVYSYAYRNWLIKSLNDDLPYDKFLLYQLAAEQLVDWNSPEKTHLAALGFLSLSKNGKTELVIDDRIDTTFRGMMALTVSCARCHDHKFDPISTSEYYGLYGVFMNSFKEERPEVGEPKMGPEWDKYLKDRAAQQKLIDDFLAPKFAKLRKEDPKLTDDRALLTSKLSRADKRELTKKQGVYDKFVADAKMDPDKAIILVDTEKPRAQRIFIRGAPGRQGDEAPRRFLTFGKEVDPVAFTKGSGRLELAQQIVTPDNPLTARNIVNRVWMWHFGEGIVRTIDDFGIQGELPDHPELLDFLATWFVENGWSIKELHRLILTSETWQQTSVNTAEEKNMFVDPENRLLWKYNKRRLDLEQMRDGILDVTGTLSEEMYGRTVKILEPPYSNRRSVYAFIDRQNLNPIFRNFDFSNPQETTAKRPSTTIPMQALFTMNSKFMQDRATELAKKGVTQKDPIQLYHRAVFAKEPTENDRLLADSFFTSVESEMKEYAKRQTNTAWSYGYGEHDEKSEKVSFTPYPLWTGTQWQIEKETPIKNNPLSYLYARAGATHPGHTSKESSIYQWQAPSDLRVRIAGIIERNAVGKGNGVKVKVITNGGKLLFDKVMDPAKKAIPVTVDAFDIAKNDLIYFIIDPHENNSAFDSVTWSPQVIDASGKIPKWGLSDSFSGPATPATPHSAYVHALLNTNRFLFIE